MKALVIPDVHLKPWMFNIAGEIMEALIALEETLPEEQREEIGAVSLGDWADDFEKENDLDLYRETFDAGIGFMKSFPNARYCVGNHDISYVWKKKESGYTENREIQVLVREKMEELEKALKPGGRFAFLHCIDNVIFSHAGLSKPYYYRHVGTSSDLESFISKINTMYGVSELWTNASPIWARIQTGWFQNFAPLVCNKLQVVGHTPLEKVQFEEEEHLLSLDVFSTRTNGKPIGDARDIRFVVVDTVKETYRFADEIVPCGSFLSYYS